MWIFIVKLKFNVPGLSITHTGRTAGKRDVLIIRRKIPRKKERSWLRTYLGEYTITYVINCSDFIILTYSYILVTKNYEKKNYELTD